MLYVSGARLVVPLSAALLAGCAGNGAGLDANGQPLGSGSGAPAPLTADFQSIQDNVFTPICVRCHSGAGAPEGLALDAAHSYALLVGVPSNEDAGLLRVKPGVPDSSYIVLKLQGSPGIVGAQMPFGGPPLPQATIDVIRQWITNGAANGAMASAANGAMTRAAAARFAVAVTSPEDQSVVVGPVTQIVVAFNHEVDASLINDTTLRLERLTADAAAPSGSISARLAEGNPSVLVIIPRSALGAGTYRLTLRGSGGGALADVDARALGNDYRSEFTVDSAP
jgi:methionine-rich copper-binding protein CopC